MNTKTRFFTNAALASAITLGLASQAVAQQDWDAINEETLRHFRALLQFDTSDPPGRELPAAEYIRDVLEAEGVAGLFTGYSSNIAYSFPADAIKFLVYEALQLKVLAGSARQPR